LHDYLQTTNGLKVILAVVEQMFGEQLQRVIEVGPPAIDPFITTTDI
jgi:CDP-glycerol glycerophosphotransferase (TagB/SpsB family)